jgi:hypothetical protein
LRFYVGGLGFSKTKEWVPEGRLRWCWLELDDVALMLQEFWTEGPHTNVPSTPLGLGVSINFTCRDALTIYREISARGVEAKRPFVGNAMWVTSVSDPDGYQLYFESPTDEPEETIYSGN